LAFFPNQNIFFAPDFDVLGAFDLTMFAISLLPSLLKSYLNSSSDVPLTQD